MTQETLEQRRAKHAWDRAAQGLKRHGDGYMNLAKGLPALIMNSGLMQVMAFTQQKQDVHTTLAGHLRDWLHQQHGTPKEFPAFMTHLYELEDARHFQAIQAEALAWLKWLRQLSSALAATEHASEAREGR